MTEVDANKYSVSFNKTLILLIIPDLDELVITGG